MGGQPDPRLGYARSHVRTHGRQRGQCWFVQKVCDDLKHRVRWQIFEQGTFTCSHGSVFLVVDLTWVLCERSRSSFALFERKIWRAFFLVRQPIVPESYWDTFGERNIHPDEKREIIDR